MTTTSRLHTHTGILGEVTDLLVALEAEHHDAGWDNRPPTLYRVSREPGGSLHTAAARLGMLGHHPRVELRAMADGFNDPAAAALIEGIFTTGPIAHFLIFEAWMRGYNTPAERDAETRAFADLPGSLEGRNAVAVIGKRMMAVTRVRGKDAVLVDPDSDPNVRIGVLDPKGMFASLCDIHRAASRCWLGGERTATR